MELYPLSAAVLSDPVCGAVNKAQLREFFVRGDGVYDDAALAEVLKVINVVLKVHFNAYYYYWDDLRSQALLEIILRRDRYDQSYEALGFCYTIARNEVGNLLRRLVREDRCDLSSSAMVNKQVVSESVPTELDDYFCFLSGEVCCGRMEVPAKISEGLLVFCERGVSGVSTDVARGMVISKLLEAIRL